MSKYFSILRFDEDQIWFFNANSDIKHKVHLL